jgi:hypothetical protein
MLPGRGQGFFDDRTPQIVPLNTPVASGPVLVGGEAVVPTLSGALVGFDLATLGDVHTVFDSTEVSALGALPDGDLAVAEANGGVDLLRLDNATGQFEVDAALAPLTGLPSEPSALAVLQSDTSLRVLVTQAGSNALFVFAMPSAGPVPPLSPTAPEPTAAPLPTAPLVVVVTLLSEGLPLETGPATAPGEQAASPPSGEPAAAHGAALAGGDSTEPPPEPPPVSPLAGPDLIEALEKLRLLPSKPEEEVVPPPAPGPVQDAPPPVPQEEQPPVAPLDAVWSDLSWLEGSSPVRQAEVQVVSAGHVPQPTMTEGDPAQATETERPISSERLDEAGSPSGSGCRVSHVLAMLGILGLPRGWRRPARAESRRPNTCTR